MTKLQPSRRHNIPQWQSHKMRQLIIDRWQEIWTVVEARNKTNKTSSLS
ncbi:hypothetical protein [Pleurocapsa sp. PCC 7319]|nr:hypothetical protein [Pleurocapsa sp. PCC 7319]